MQAQIAKIQYIHREWCLIGMMQTMAGTIALLKRALQRIQLIKPTILWLRQLKN